MKRLAILGGGGHGKVVACAAECAGWGQIVFFDDSWPATTENSAWQVVGGMRELLSMLASFNGVIVGIGDNHARHLKMMELIAANAPLVSIIHPTAVVSRYAEIGGGSVVFGGTVINADARVGRGAIINTSATVDHDCVLGEAVHLSPGVNLGGNVKIGNLSWIGIGSCVRHGINIGDRVMVGAGAAVVRDIPDGLTVAGVPARKIRD